MGYKVNQDNQADEDDIKYGAGNAWVSLDGGTFVSVELLYQVFKERLLKDLEVKTQLRSSHIKGQYAESYIREKNDANG